MNAQCDREREIEQCGVGEAGRQIAWRYSDMGWDDGDMIDNSP